MLTTNFKEARRQAIVLFDSDIVDNRSVAKAAKFIANWARGRGAAPHKVLLPNEPDGRKNGADDFLVRHGVDQLILRLEKPKVIGFPLLSPLLTEDGDIRHDLDPPETGEAISAAAQISDVSVLDAVTRRLCKKLGRKYDELVIQIEEAATKTMTRGFWLPSKSLIYPALIAVGWCRNCCHAVRSPFWRLIQTSESHSSDTTSVER